MLVGCLTCAAVLLGSSVVHAITNSTPQALNTTNHNLIDNAGGPVLYYNGSGNVPSYYEVSPVPTPITPLNSTAILADAFYKETIALGTGSSLADNCSRCIAGAEMLHLVAITLPVSTFTDILVRVCNARPAVQKTICAVNCQAQYGTTGNSSIAYSSGAGGTGPYYAQLFSKMSASTDDFNWYCNINWDVCPTPKTIGINEDLYFSPKPAPANVVPAASGKSISVLHISDWHIDPRYDVGSEANCSQYLCCRPYATNTKLKTTAANASVPASRFGYLYCDSPPDLAISSLTTMPQFFNMNNVSFSIFTGDIVSYDNDDQLSRAYVEYSEMITYQTFNYFNMTNPDQSGILKSLAADQLTACEARGQRAWIIGHVLSGYSGNDALQNPSALFYSIVRRFSPATIAGVFFGQTHEDQLQLFYDFLPNSTCTVNGTTYRNTSMVDYTKPLQVGYIGPSIAPLTGNNAGYQLYQVDASTFSVTGVQTYFANVSEANPWTTPVWKFEYDARTAYAPAATNGTTWPSTAPLNATFWHGVTQSMLNNQTLVQMHNFYETKSSVVTKNCTSAACGRQKVCYIRSGNAELATVPFNGQHEELKPSRLLGKNKMNAFNDIMESLKHGL